jgi:hypothetical protein
LFIFRPNSDEEKKDVILKEVKQESKYSVRTEDHSTPDATYSGKDLMTSGLSMQPPARYTGDLVYLEGGN